jgi:hypothetical protein
MNSQHSPKEKQGIYTQPRPLTPSEVASLRQDAISVSAEMKEVISERSQRQQRAMGKLMALPELKLAAE